MNNQMQSNVPENAPIVGIGPYRPVPAPNGDEMLNRGEDNENLECVLHSPSVQSF